MLNTQSERDTIGEVAPELGCSIEDLAAFNGLDKNYTLILGNTLRYINQREKRQTCEYARLHAFSLRDDNPEHVSFMKMAQDIEKDNIQYGNGPGTPASVVLVFAEAYTENKK
jgi:hypothetical protein